jgi:hypothetical protein
MKINLIAPLGFAAVAGIAVISMTILMSNKGGAPDGRSSSIGDSGSTCTTCHGGSALTMAGLITTDIPGTGYVPNETYNITVSGDDGRTRYGFEMSAENSVGTKVGTFTNTPIVGILPSKNVTHNSSSIDFGGTVGSWVVPWTAPGPGVGSITFSSSFLAADGNGGTSGSGDQVFKGNTTVTEGIASSIPEKSLATLKIYPNPTVDEIQIDLSENISSVKVFDISGKIWKLIGGLNQEKVKLSLANLPSGFYLVEITATNGTIQTKKISKV